MGRHPRTKENLYKFGLAEGESGMPLEKNKTNLRLDFHDWGGGMEAIRKEASKNVKHYQRIWFLMIVFRTSAESPFTSLRETLTP